MKHHTYTGVLTKPILIMGGVMCLLLGIFVLLMQSLINPLPKTEYQVEASSDVGMCEETITIPPSLCNEACSEDSDCDIGLTCYRLNTDEFGVCRISTDLTNTVCEDPSPSVSPEITPNISQTPTPSPSLCFPRPPCLDEIPTCELAEPDSGWCITPTDTPTPTPPEIIEYPSWFSILPPNLKGFLEQLYLTVFVFRRNTNLQHLLEL